MIKQVSPELNKLPHCTKMFHMSLNSLYNLWYHLREVLFIKGECKQLNMLRSKRSSEEHSIVGTFICEHIENNRYERKSQ